MMYTKFFQSKYFGESKQLFFFYFEKQNAIILQYNMSYIFKKEGNSDPTQEELLFCYK